VKILRLSKIEEVLEVLPSGSLMIPEIPGIIEILSIERG
jgi:hypothetical protein